MIIFLTVAQTVFIAWHLYELSRSTRLNEELKEKIRIADAFLKGLTDNENH